MSNFKGGSASIHEDEASIRKKLQHYSAILRQIDQQFGNRPLRLLTPPEVQDLIVLANQFISLTESVAYKIEGFGASYGSALLHFYFPQLLPILDRRVIESLEIDAVRERNGQIKDIGTHFGAVIHGFYIRLLANPTKTARELDAELFTQSVMSR